MEIWEGIVTAVSSAAVSVGGVKIFESFFRRGASVGRAAVRGHTQRKIAEVKLTGDAQKDISTITHWALEEFRKAQVEQHVLYAEISDLKHANADLGAQLARVKQERDIALADNAKFIAQVTDLLAQANHLAKQLAEAVRDKAILEIEHEGAKARLAAREKLIAEMQQYLDDAHAREARLEAENERLRATRT